MDFSHEAKAVYRWITGGLNQLVMINPSYKHTAKEVRLKIGTLVVGR
jgi:hypothetical protein